MIEDLTDIEISAHELAIGNFDQESFEADCLHIANLAAKLVDQLKQLKQ
jgi:hypothetical protein